MVVEASCGGAVRARRIADGRIAPGAESADFLVIGSGIAGLRAAATLAAHGVVLVLTKAD